MVLPLSRDDLRDALDQLRHWIGDGCEIQRTMRLDEAEHAALTERIKVVSDALQVCPNVRRTNGQTVVRVRAPDGKALTAGEIRLAARIEDVYRTVTSTG